MYKYIAEGNPLEFLLNPYNKETGDEKVLFKFKPGQVSTNGKFYRIVDFSDDETKKERNKERMKNKRSDKAYIRNLMI